MPAPEYAEWIAFFMTKDQGELQMSATRRAMKAARDMMSRGSRPLRSHIKEGN